MKLVWLSKVWVSPKSALVSTSWAAALDRFPVAAGREVHRDHHQFMLFCSFLGFLHLFMHKMHKSEAQLTGCSLQCCYSWNSTTISSSCYGNNRDPQIRSTKEDRSPHISRGRQIILILSIGKAYIILFLSECSFLTAYQAQQCTSSLSALFILVLCYQGSAWQDTFFSRDVY